MTRQTLRREVTDPQAHMSTTSSTHSITPSESISAVASAVPSYNTATNRTSWVWQYFSTVTFKDKTAANVCRANKGFIDKPPDLEAPIVVCQEKLSIDKSSSTKSMIRHLSRAHHIEAPIDTSQQTLTAFSSTGKTTSVSLIYLIFNQPFLIFSFLILLSRWDR